MTRIRSTRRNMLIATAFICLISFGSGCQTSIKMAEAGDVSAVHESGKIPAKEFFGNPLFSKVSLSPNGFRIAALVSREGQEAILAIDLRDGTRTGLAKLERRDSSHSTASNTIEMIGWASNNTVVMSASRPLVYGGIRARRTVLMASDIRDPRVIDLGEDWPFAGFNQFPDRIISYLPDDPDRILVDWFGSARQVELKSSRLRVSKLRKKGVRSWQADHNFRVRIGFGGEERNNSLEDWGRVTDSDRLEKLVRWDPLSVDEEGTGFLFAGFSENAETIYVLSERETGRYAVYEYDLKAHEIGRTIFANSEFDIDGIRTSKVDGRLLSINYKDLRRVVHFVDPEHQRKWARIYREFDGKTVEITSSDRNENSAIFVVSADDSPHVYYRVDHSNGEYSRLFRARPGLDGQSLAKTEPIQFEARDGLKIRGYVTRPVNADGPNATIVFPHDGPFGRTLQEWDGTVQFFASRGFTVFQLNQRGSTGYGRKFREAGYQQFGRAAQDDVTDGVKWLIESGIADRGRIGIFGSGYGGYTALQGLASTPELYAAGASWGGISDLVTLLDDDNLGYYGADAVNKALIGSRWTDRGKLALVSPVQNAEKIRAPVLLGHGTDDSRQHIRHTDRMVSALEAAGVEHEVYRYLGEGHSFIDERTRIAFYQSLGDFFERHLKPNPEFVTRPLH